MKFPGNISRGDIYKLPFKEGSFDLVLSVGILEHFLENDQQKMYDELVRVTKRNGLIYTLVPSYYGYFYRLGMEKAKKTDSWPFGYEMPLKTVKNLNKNNGSVDFVKEISGGCLIQLYYLFYYLKKAILLKMIYISIIGLLNRFFWKINFLPRFGFFILNIAKKT